MSDALDRLARAYGIEPSYVSERGEERSVSDASKRGLLQALGVPSGSIAEIERGLASVPRFGAGVDIGERERLGWYSGEQAAELRKARAGDLALLLAALKHAGVLPNASELVLAGDRPYPEELPAEICVAAHAMLAKAASRLIAVQLEDLAGVADQANLPGTVDEYPNWRRKLPLDIAQLAETELFRNVTEAMSWERPRSS